MIENNPDFKRFIDEIEDKMEAFACHKSQYFE
jgi:hypothetical protein